uniref:Uncharacterized protein n=1 Tax=Meloidogyne enterolobii TaxID=390850 RepID=A0A6V7WR89_MELEN|nr:unnamed protein product [Meloidogyne enterolobii]
MIKAEDEEMMGVEQRIRASSSNSAASIHVRKHAVTAQRRTSIQSARHRRYNLGKIDLRDINNIHSSPPASPPPMSHGRRTSTVFREILLGNLRIEDVTFSDKASTTATAGSSTTHTPTNMSPVDSNNDSVNNFSHLETSSVASTSTSSNNYFASDKKSSSPTSSKQQIPTLIKPPLERNDSIASTSTTTSTFSYIKSLFFRRTSKVTTSQNSQASSECGRRKSSLAKVIDEELEDLREEEENEKKKMSVDVGRGEREGIIKNDKLVEKDVTRESFASSNGNPSRIKDTGGGLVLSSPPTTYPPQASSTQSNNRTLSSASVGNESSTVNSTNTTATTNIEHLQQQKKATTNLQKWSKRSADLRIFIVWLERLEDLSTFPIAEMFPFTTNDINTLKHSTTTILNSNIQTQQQQTIDHLVFYIYPFERGLRRIQIAGIWTKQGRPGPLHNGTVVSTRSLPLLLKQTICNVARRKAAEIDNYQMTHLKRKQAIAEFGRRFATRQDYTEFVEHLLEDNSASFSGTVFPP